MKRHFFTLDVFTSHPLCGNPLGVVLDSAGLDEKAMQQIAAEFNLSETVFVLPPEQDGRARIRIFTPKHELPFAGHPTVGTAVLLAELDGLSGEKELILEEKIGPITCKVTAGAKTNSARFEMPRIPSQVEWSFDVDLLASSLGLKKSDLGFGDHKVSVWNGGLNYVLVPVSSLEAVRSINVDNAKLNMVGREFDGQIADIFVYCAGGESDQADFHARMFAPGR